MAGSLSDFKYIDNSGRAWLIRLDRSNCLATGTGFVPLQQADLNLDYLPRNIELRYVVAKHPTRPIKREIYCATTTCPLWRGEQETITLVDYQDKTNQVFNVGNRIQERKKYTAKVLDTYQNDSPT
ncbi:hypothetical protein B9G53_03510 [Pseudanabaena sp. SR411]|uniref:hypothetical protein n=1 Tax=Pseudanabaena sp. SR411 TaxID=1980935 RepID=UPI000B97EC28|nr:hypothetical protein [Pseudanabaena sp. SR411]OYQ66647.1 hypothetical protein B9G53_03510 [Pseudanabaena sp. SR411]